MDHVYESSTVEMDNDGFDDLQQQLLNNKGAKAHPNQDIREAQAEENDAVPQQLKKFVFRKGDHSVEMDDDYELEFMADKKSTKLTLKELKDRAAGDIAVKNRMHSLAEEKKRVQSTFKQFAEIAKTDPLAALEFISSKAKESDSEFEYENYINKLAEQAEMLGDMDEQERKAWNLEKKLKVAEENLSQKERIESVVLRKQEILGYYPEIGDSQFAEMVDAVLENEELSGDLENEHEVMDKVEELILETLTQRDIMTVIKEINPRHLHDNELIFSLSDQIRQNPDLDEEDIRDIVRELIGTTRGNSSSGMSERERDARVLSSKARQSRPVASHQLENASAYDLLAQQLTQRKSELSKTPLYKR